MNHKMVYLLRVSRSDFIYESIGVFNTEELAIKYVEDNYRIWNSDMKKELADDESTIECYEIERVAFIQ